VIVKYINSTEDYASGNKEVYLLYGLNISGIGNCVGMHQAAREWVDDNKSSNLCIIFVCNNGTLRYAEDIAKCNPDIDELWVCNKPNDVFINDAEAFANSHNYKIISKINCRPEWELCEDALMRKKKLIGLKVPNEFVDFAEEWRSNNIKTEKMFILHIRQGASEGGRNPDFGNYVKLAKEVVNVYPQVTFAYIGIPSDAPIDYDRIVNARNLSWMQQCGLMSISDMYIGCSSGPQMMAAALKIPMVVGSHLMVKLAARPFLSKILHRPKMEPDLYYCHWKIALDGHGKPINQATWGWPNQAVNPASFKDTPWETMLDSVKKLGGVKGIL